MIDRKKLAQRLAKGSQVKKLPIVNLLIILIALIEPIGQLFRIGFLQILKPIPIILMIYYIHDKNTSRDHLVPSLVKYGLCLSLVGDVCLMLNDMPSFLIGTGFFMVAHLFYITAFRIGSVVKRLKSNYVILRRVGYVVIFILLLLNYYDLWDKFPSKIMFVSYCGILAIQAMVCLQRYQKTQNSSFFFILIGTALFAISDNLLGFLKFNEIKTDLGRMFIMFTYYGAQFFIMHGALHQSNLIFEINKLNENHKKKY